MNKLSIAIFLSLIIAVMPHLGFPTDIEMIFFTASGIMVAALIHLSRKQNGELGQGDEQDVLTVEDIQTVNIERKEQSDEDDIQEELSKKDES